MPKILLEWLWGKLNKPLLMFFYSISHNLQITTITIFLFQGNDNKFLKESECFKVCQPEEEDFHPNDEQGSATYEEEDPEDDYYKYTIPVFLPFRNKTDNSPSSVCSSPYDEGPCLPLDPAKYLQRYYHNHTTGTMYPEIIFS